MAHGLPGAPSVPIEQRFWTKVDRSGDGCWEWQAHRSPAGYGQVWLDGTNVGAHRVAYQLTNGPIPEGMLVRHKCDNPPCVRPDHLEIGSVIDNYDDMVGRGRRNVSRSATSRYVRGDTHPSSRLTTETVRAIREAVATGKATQTEMARAHGVTVQAIHRIVRGLVWKEAAAWPSL